MSNSSSAYTKVATVLWLGGALLFALAITMALDFPPRAEGFVFVLIVGGAVLVRLNLKLTSKEKKKSDKVYTTIKSSQASEGTKNTKTPTTTETSVETPLNANVENSKLSGDDARQWLDDFLVKQQGKK